MLHVAVCEDLESELAILLPLIEKSPYDTTVTTFSCGEDFLADFRPKQYDLIIMDIFMKNLSGVDVISQIRALDPSVSVAFFTSSKDFALEGYRLNVLKYIEKPATAQAVEEALQLAYLHTMATDRLTLASSAASFPLGRMMYLEQAGRSLLLHMADGQTQSATKKLDDILPQLEGKSFFRCHKSYVVNLDFVRGIDRDLSTFEMADGSQVHIRRESLRAAKKAFEDYLFSGESEVTL